MRKHLIALLSAAGLAVAGLVACGPEEPKSAGVAQALEEAAQPGALWPVMLAHCLRAPTCDPMADFGQGAGQASGLVDQVSYFVESAEVVKEGGEDYGAAITLSLFATRGQGGKAGRPLTIDETASDLRIAKARRSTLSIEYRAPGGAPEAYSLALMSPQIAFAAPERGNFKTQEEMTRASEAHVDAMRWANGERGARMEIAAKSGVVFSGYSTGMPAADIFDAKAALRRGFEPWVFYFSQNIRDEPLPALMAAIEAGETLGLKITAPDSGVMLQDAIYTAGYSQALREATEALTDPELGRTIPERCARFEAERDEFWKIADVTAALRVCDPRSVEQRRQASAPAAPAPDR
jgi:hypothetical protein